MNQKPVDILTDTKGKNTRREELIQCSVCHDYFRVNEGFQCPKCRRNPLCKKHRSPGRRECVSCVIDMKLRELTNLRGQEKSIQNFIRFLQFLFLVFAVFFIALKIGVGEEIGWIKDNIFAENLIYIGLGNIFVYMIFYLVMVSQRKRNDMIASEIEKIGAKRY
jgi:hypothetical protein